MAIEGAGTLNQLTIAPGSQEIKHDLFSNLEEVAKAHLDPEQRSKRHDQEEVDLLRKLSPGETLEENMWRDKLARVVEAYSKLQQWELDVLTSQSQKDAYGDRKWWQKKKDLGQKDLRKRFVAT